MDVRGLVLCGCRLGGRTVIEVVVDVHCGFYCGLGVLWQR